MKYFLDTNIILIYLRNNNTRYIIDKQFAPFSYPNIPIVSVVTIGEIRSIGIRNKWGKQKIINVERIFEKCVIVGKCQALINKRQIRC